jgi:hypothetical protein
MFVGAGVCGCVSIHTHLCVSALVCVYVHGFCVGFCVHVVVCVRGYAVMCACMRVYRLFVCAGCSCARVCVCTCFAFLSDV